MSLDVYLHQAAIKVTKSSSGIFIRENGETKELTKQDCIDYPDADVSVFR
jgi:hypothetical protein